MKNRTHFHLTDEETLALAAFRYELLSDTLQEVEQCEACMHAISNVHMLNVQLRDISSKSHAVPTSDRLAAMTAVAFDAIEAEQSETEEVTHKSSSFIPWLTAVAATVLFVVGVYHYSTPTSTVKQSRIAQLGTDILTLTKDAHLFAQDCIINDGVTTLTVLKNATLHKKGEQKYAMSDGKVHVKVTKGNNTLIHINDEFLVRVLGTEFTIEAYNHALDVTVTEGMVEVVHLGTGEVRTLTKDQNCHYDFKQIKKLLLIKQPPLIKQIPRRNHKLIAPRLDKKLSTGTYLEQGRMALEKGDSKKALTLFTSALHQKGSADKALFEIIRIYEGKKDYKAVLRYLTKYRAILKQYKTYREEFFVKGCNAQVGMKSGNLSFCNQYLQLFPEGYKCKEIKILLGDKK